MGLGTELVNFFAEPILPSKDIYLVKRRVDNCLIRKFGRVKSTSGSDGSHWAFTIEGKFYHLGVRKDKTIYLDTKPFTVDPKVKPRKVGTTKNTHQLIKERGEWIAGYMNDKGGYKLLSNNCQYFVNYLFWEIDVDQNPPTLSTFGKHRDDTMPDLFGRNEESNY